MTKSQIIVLLVFTSPMLQAGIVNDFKRKIQYHCQKHHSPLLVKKVLIEIMSNSDEPGPFTKTLIKQCPELNLKELKSIYRKSENDVSGNIIGH